jgi:tetratricopeptide (TPR) repeat protein
VPVRRGRRLAVAAAALTAVAAAAVLLLRPGSSDHAASGSGDPGVPIVALGRITDYRPSAATELTRPLTDMLATNLGRVPGLRVMSTARMYELVSHGGTTPEDTTAAALVRAARHAGATELIDGALYARDDGGFRLDLRRVELATGSIRQTHSVTGATIFDLADSGTARLAADFGQRTPAGSIADVTTRSLAAYRLYEQGLRAFYANDRRGAKPLFEAALTEDSTFAMAAYYAALSEQEDRVRILERFELAKRLAEHTTDRERLIILARYAFLSSSPALRPLGDTLMIRYPDEVQGYYYTGLGTMMDGQYLQAVGPFNRVVAMDSLALVSGSARCEACDAFRQIIVAYQSADSLLAAERTARRWIRLQPGAAVPWLNLAEVLSMSGRGAEALAAFDSAARLGAGRAEAERLIIRATHLIYAAQFEAADRLLDGEVASGVTFRMFEALWYRAISYRTQGRLREALDDTRRYREIGLNFHPRGVGARLRAVPYEALGYAQVLFEMGRYRESGAVFDSVSRWVAGNESEAQIIKNHAWAITHASRAWAAAGDTARLQATADSVERETRGSGIARDRLLHHFIRGLLLEARGQHEAACTAYRASISSWSGGYTRANMALAECLLRVGRPREAVPAVQSSLRGDLQASNYYASRTELHELLGRAWEAVGTAPGRDSAVAHYRVVIRNWARADPQIAERRRSVEQRLAALTAN